MNSAISNYFDHFTISIGCICSCADDLNCASQYQAPMSLQETSVNIIIICMYRGHTRRNLCGYSHLFCLNFIRITSQPISLRLSYYISTHLILSHLTHLIIPFQRNRLSLPLNRPSSNHLGITLHLSSPNYLPPNDSTRWYLGTLFHASHMRYRRYCYLSLSFLLRDTIAELRSAYFFCLSFR